MKPLKADPQLRSVSLAYPWRFKRQNQNPLHEGETAGMQALIEVSRRGVEKCFRLTSSLIG